MKRDTPKSCKELERELLKIAQELNRGQLELLLRTARLLAE